MCDSYYVDGKNDSGRIFVRESDIERVLDTDNISTPDWLGKVVPISEWQEGAIQFIDVDGRRAWFIPENPEYGKEDLAEFIEWWEGKWFFVGVFARVSVVVRGTTQTLRTPGLWSIESSSSSEYIEEIFQEEKQLLLEILGDLGIAVVRDKQEDAAIHCVSEE